MASSQYKFVRAVIGESNQLMRGSMRAALYDQGMRDVEICTRGDALYEALGREIIDVLICDTDLADQDFVETVRNIRQTLLGRNPFMGIIAVVADPSAEQVKQIIDSGVDDLVRKPMAMDFLLSRVGSLTSNRKPFVVTASYIGPTRRGGGRLEKDEPYLVDVPNTLRSKVVDKVGIEKIESTLEAAILDIRSRKERGPAYAIHSLIQRVLEHYQGMPNVDDLLRDINRLVSLGEDVAHSNKGTPLAHLSEIAVSMVRTAKRIAAAPLAPQGVNLELLMNLGEVIKRSVAPGEHSADVVWQIADTVGKFTGDASAKPRD